VRFFKNKKVYGGENRKKTQLKLYKMNNRCNMFLVCFSVFLGWVLLLNGEKHREKEKIRKIK